MVLGLILISIATPWISETVRVRWFTRPANDCSPEWLGAILIGACLTLPVIVGCTGFAYRVFRGKTIELDHV